MFRHQVAITPGDIDHMGHVNNSVYLKWVQDAVVAYWQKVAPSDAVVGGGAAPDLNGANGGATRRRGRRTT